MRPTYTEKVGRTICERIAEGEPLRPICRDLGIYWRTIYGWMERHEDFREQFARARQVGFDAIAEEALEIANTPVVGETETVGPDGTTIKREDMLGHRKLQIWTRLQLLAKWDPKRYGEKVDHTLKGDAAAPIVISNADAKL